MKHLNKKSVGFGLLMLILVGVLSGFTLKKAHLFVPTNLRQDVPVINATDTDITESEDDDDDEWEA